MCNLSNRPQTLFYENEFYQNNQAQICTDAFQYFRNHCFLRGPDSGVEKILLFQYLERKTRFFSMRNQCIRNLVLGPLKKIFRNYKRIYLLYYSLNFHYSVWNFATNFSIKICLVFIIVVICSVCQKFRLTIIILFNILYIFFSNRDRI